MSVRRALDRGPQKVLAPLGLRLVPTKRLRPSGFKDSLFRVREKGIAIEQVVDVGAARGEWTRACMDVFPEARYFLLDPLESNAAVIEAAFHEHPKVTFWCGGLGAEPGHAEFHIHPGFQGDTSSFLGSEHDLQDGSSVATVEIRTMDSFLGTEMLCAPQLIKADVQGFELEVLRGAARCLETAELVLLEVQFRQVYEQAPLAHDAIAWMGERGFPILDICSYVQRPSDLELGEADLLFARSDSVAFEPEGWE